MMTRSSFSSWVMLTTLSLAAMAFTGCSAGADSESGLDGDNQDVDQTTGALEERLCQNGGFKTRYGGPVWDQNISRYKIYVYVPFQNPKPAKEGWVYATKRDATVFSAEGTEGKRLDALTGYRLEFNKERTQAVLTWSNGQGRITLSCNRR